MTSCCKSWQSGGHSLSLHVPVSAGSGGVGSRGTLKENMANLGTSSGEVPSMRW